MMKIIPGFDGKYSITEDGKVWSNATNRFLTPQIVKGYIKYMLFFNGKGIYRYAHRLLWLTFNGEIPLGYEINHKNEIRNDNRLENLELLTHYDNLMYGNRTEKHRESLKKSKRLPRRGKCNFAKKYIFINKSSGGKFYFNCLLDACELFNIKDWTFQYLIKKMKRKNQKTICINDEEYYIKKLA